MVFVPVPLCCLRVIEVLLEIIIPANCGLLKGQVRVVSTIKQVLIFFNEPISLGTRPFHDWLNGCASDSYNNYIEIFRSLHGFSFHTDFQVQTGRDSLVGLGLAPAESALIEEWWDSSNISIYLPSRLSYFHSEVPAFGFTTWFLLWSTSLLIGTTKLRWLI